ncbi:LOW QUALITY PROTEIN: EKC/KEOPS complex subunit LAGE3 [Hyaena hyaena]|uniref:LOW QUALITY PROTEIN: EKC/KEOPS complex subunit LAGE3 n=1 Tax=Hyaena hyaena TaxID=95912 RepID=UPI001921B340|nr:LOW QUALITY PROTEIN: EKC/KEOPS complex subunit LAGE3 [Hyaena hyaena]
MEAAGGGAGGPDDGREGREGPEGQVDYHGLGGAGAEAAGAGAEAGVPGEAPRVPRPLHVPGPGGDATSTTGMQEARVYIFALCVPFMSHLEAEIACASLAPDREPHGSVVDKKLTVTASILAARWRAEDPRLLRLSIINFLDQLSLVMRTMQRFGPRFPLSLRWGQGTKIQPRVPCLGGPSFLGQGFLQ